MGKNYSEEIAVAVRSYLEEEGMMFCFDKEKGLFNFGTKLRDGLVNRIEYVIDIKEDRILTYAFCPVKPDEHDEDQMLQMAAFLTAANRSLVNGNFELDLEDDGEILYKSFIDCEDLLPSSGVIENSILAPAAMLKRYMPGICAIVFNGASWRDAVAETERKKSTWAKLALERALDEELDDKHEPGSSEIDSLIREIKEQVRTMEENLEEMERQERELFGEESANEDDDEASSKETA